MTCRAFILGLLLLGAYAQAETVTLSTPIAGEVYVKGDGKATALRGKLTSYDEQQFTMHVGSEDKTLNWTDVTTASAYALRQKAVDRTQASSWIELGRFAWAMGLKDQAKTAFHSAVRLNAASQAEADTILATPAGSMLAATPTTGPAGNELMQAGSAPAPTRAPAKVANPAAPTTFKPASAEDTAAAMAMYREQAEKIQKDLNLHFEQFETDHFLVFTDWDTRESGFIKENLEGAYRVVSKQFDQNPKDNVFIGKLPVYMLGPYKEFHEFAQTIDKFPVTDRTAGYYAGYSFGGGHMVMWKPDKSMTGTSNIEDAKRLWAYVLVHEFTHAFLARYRSDVFIPRWLNEGIAEVTACSAFPNPDHARMAHMMAVENKDLSFLFDSSNIPTGEYYPVMQSMTELLIRENRQNFLKLINAIKDGEDTEAALGRLYHTDFKQLAHVWREWGLRH